MRNLLLVALFFCFSGLLPGQSFKNPRRVALAVNPTAVMAGDLNGDGVPDLVYGTGVAANAALHSLLADGKGGYAPGSDIVLPAGVSARCRLADMNGDKRLDLVCVGFNAEVVAVLLGKGDGSFAPAMTVALPSNGDSTLLPAAIADLNGDGTPDLVVTTGGLQHYVLLNDGTGKLSVAPLLMSTVYGISVQVADLNGDGHPDLLVQAGTLNTEVQFGHGDGTFTRGPEFGGNAGAVLADMDGDGHPDLVAGGGGILKIFHGNPDGSFGTAPIATADYTDGNRYDESGFGVYLRPFAVLDLNGDGILDVLAYGDNGLTVLLGQPGLTFGAPRSFPVGEDLFFPSSPSTQRLIDMDGDGHPDFVSVGPNGIYISYGRGDGSFVSADVYRSGYDVADLTVADFDEDGQPDVVTSGDSALYLSRGKPDGTFGPAAMISTALPSQTNVTYAGGGSVFHGDFNADGHQDLLVNGTLDRSPAGKAVLLPGHGDGTFGPPALVSNFAEGSYVQAVTDVDGDGRDDIVAQKVGESPTIYLAQADGTFRTTSVSAIAVNTEPQITLSDLNGDGLPEIVFATAQELVVLPNIGGGNFGNPLRYPLPQLPSGMTRSVVSCAIGDFDGDGAPDVAIMVRPFASYPAVGPSGSQILTFYRQGSRSALDAGSFTTAVTGPASELLYDTLEAVDLDGDGTSDVLVVGSNYVSSVNAVSTFLGKSDRTFGPEQDFVAGAAFNSVALADLNRDGRPDLVVGNGIGSEYGDAFTVLLSQGAPIAPSAPSATGTLMASPNPVSAGGIFTITAALKLSGAVAKLTGTADFSVDGKDLGTVSFAEGLATVNGPTTLSPGVHQLSATTSALGGAGGTTYAALHLVGQVTVSAVASSLGLSATPNPAAVGQTVTFKVLLANGAGSPATAPAPTGAVSVTVNGANIASVSDAASAAGGVLTYTFPSPGTYTITASYAGDSAHAGSTATLTEVVQAVVAVTSDFTLGLSSPTVVVVMGQQGSVVARLGSLGTYAGTLQLGDSDLPAGVTAAFSPGQVTLAATGQGNSTLQIAAAGATSSAVRSLAQSGGGARLLSVVALCGGLLPMGLRRRRARRFAAAVMLVIAGFGLQGCGFSGVPLILPGSYEVTVTATDMATHKTKSAKLEIVIVTQAPQLASAPKR